MPAGYRIELSPSNRASCNGTKPCKGTKINKDELRFGTWVEIRDNGSFKWRHWGCVTSKVLDHLKEAFPDPEDIDGFEDLPPPYQDKIKEAFAVGHVAEEDIPESARFPPKLDENGEPIPASQSPKKSPAKPKKAAKKTGGEDGAAEDVKPKKRAPKKKKDDEDADEEPKKKSKAKPRKKRTPTPTPSESELSDSESEASMSASASPKKKPKKSKPTKAKSSAKKRVHDSSDESEEEVVKPKKRAAGKRTVKAAAKGTAESEDWSD